MECFCGIGYYGFAVPPSRVRRENDPERPSRTHEEGELHLPNGKCFAHLATVRLMHECKLSPRVRMCIVIPCLPF